MHHQKHKKITGPDELKYSNYDIRMQMRPQEKIAGKTQTVVLFAFCACTCSYMQVSGRHSTKFYSNGYFNKTFLPRTYLRFYRYYLVHAIMFLSTVQFNLISKLRRVFFNLRLRYF